MCVSKVQHTMGRKTGCNRSRPVFFRFFDFPTNVATGNRKNSEFVQLQPVVLSFAVGFSSISVFFPVQWTGPANTSFKGMAWIHIYITRHFSHPFLGTYEVHQFLDLGYLEGTHCGVVNELHTNTTIPWNGKPIPYPTHTNTMLHTIPFDLIPYHQGCLGSFYQIWEVFLQAAILVHWAPSFVDRFFRFLLSF